MKRILIFAILPVLLSIFGSCELETSSNGKLDGFWHLESVDTLNTGGHNDLSGQLLFWSFQGKIMGLTDRNSQFRDYVMRFSHQGDSLFLSGAMLSDRTIGDQVVENDSVLQSYAVNSLEERFKVTQLSNEKMILDNGRFQLFLRKF